MAVSEWFTSGVLLQTLYPDSYAPDRTDSIDFDMKTNNQVHCHQDLVDIGYHAALVLATVKELAIEPWNCPQSLGKPVTS